MTSTDPLAPVVELVRSEAYEAADGAAAAIGAKLGVPVDSEAFRKAADEGLEIAKEIFSDGIGAATSYLAGNHAEAMNAAEKSGIAARAARTQGMSTKAAESVAIDQARHQRLEAAQANAMATVFRQIAIPIALSAIPGGALFAPAVDAAVSSALGLPTAGA